MAIITDGVKTKFTDDTGLPLIGGQVFSYVEGTSTPKDTYQDRAFTIPNTNPIILDDVGSCEMYLKGGYRLRVLDVNGVLIEEKDNAFQSDGQVLDVVANTTAIAELQTNVNVLNTRGGLKTDEHNHIIGQGKAESATVYDISLRSDKVRVSAPTDVEFGNLVFKTYDAPTVVNGVTVPTGTWLNPNLVTPLLGTAATKNVGTASDNVMQVGAFGIGGAKDGRSLSTNPVRLHGTGLSCEFHALPFAGEFCGVINIFPYFDVSGQASFFRLVGASTGKLFIQTAAGNSYGLPLEFYTTGNATKDPNGFLKGASPIAELYSDKMDLNHDATQQGYITFEKLGVGDYLVKGSLGFAQEGWYIETPKDANGNVLVAVVYEQLENNDISIKTYAKKFDDETGDIVANLSKPRDIPTGRFISLRLHELPKEPPVMPIETTTP